MREFDLKTALAGIALGALLLGPWSAQAAGAAATGSGTMTNWASDVITETASASGRDPVEANRVTLTVAGGPVVVEWSLSYTAGVSTPPLGSAEAHLLSASKRMRRSNAMALSSHDGRSPIRLWTSRCRPRRGGSRGPRAACSSTTRQAPGAGPTS
jgi:hypothetical protein